MKSIENILKVIKFDPKSQYKLTFSLKFDFFNLLIHFFHLFINFFDHLIKYRLILIKKWSNLIEKTLIQFNTIQFGPLSPNRCSNLLESNFQFSTIWFGDPNHLSLHFTFIPSIFVQVCLIWKHFEANFSVLFNY